MIRIRWYRKYQKTGWDAAEVKTSVGTVCPYVACLPGPDERAMFSLDVPDSDGKIRSLAAGFAPNLDAARAEVAKAIARIDAGLNLV